MALVDAICHVEVEVEELPEEVFLGGEAVGAEDGGGMGIKIPVQTIGASSNFDGFTWLRGLERRQQLWHQWPKI